MSSVRTLQIPRQRRSLRRPAGVRTKTTSWLPVPPSNVEKMQYYGSQHIWFIWMRTLATISGTISLVLFSVSSTPLWLFWIPFSVFVMYMALTHYATTRPRRFSKVDHERIVSLWEPATYPSVDVFLPCAGEDVDVLVNTYAHVARLEYFGNTTVYVLDDGARPEVERAARSFGFEYLVREDRPLMKKAGNLKYGFEHSDADLIVIFDADFCPRADFVTELAPYFADEAVGIVQSPQYFDTPMKMHWMQRAAGAVQESFYRWAQVSRDHLGAPICVGTCAVYRRAALEQAGGFAQIGHSEDVHTGVNLMKVGFRTLYVPVILAKGLCPDQMSSFISQQYRWCAGSMSLLRDKKFHDSPLRYRQRICFFTGFGYYISTAVGVFCLPLPTLVMVWLLPERVQLSNFFWMIPAFAMYPFIKVVHKSGWSLSTLRSYTISSFSHAAAIIHTMRGRTAEWVPTGETRRTSMTSRVTMIMVTWLSVTNLGMFAGAARFLLSGRSIVDIAPILLVGVMNLFIWIPIAAMAWRERRARLAVSAGVDVTRVVDAVG